MNFKISAEEVKRLREERGIGLIEAREILIKEQLLAAVNSATTVFDLRDVLRYLIKNV